MDLLIATINTLWTGLDSLTVPILDIKFTDFLVALLLVSAIITSINFILGRNESGGGK